MLKVILAKKGYMDEFVTQKQSFTDMQIPIIKHNKIYTGNYLVGIMMTKVEVDEFELYTNSKVNFALFKILRTAITVP